MSSVDDFRAKLSSDSAFASKVKSSLTSGEIIAAAALAGIKLTDSDLAKALAQGSSELSDAELESVSVGTPMAAALIK